MLYKIVYQDWQNNHWSSRKIYARDGRFTSLLLAARYIHKQNEEQEQHGGTRYFLHNRAFNHKKNEAIIEGSREYTSKPVKRYTIELAGKRL